MQKRLNQTALGCALLGIIFLVYMMIFLSIGLFAETPQGVFA